MTHDPAPFAASVKCLSQTSPKSDLVLLCEAGCRCKGAGELQCEDHLQERLLHSVQINQIESLKSSAPTNFRISVRLVVV